MSNESEFDAKLQRLKRVLGLSHDKDVAELLGITKAALSDRKRRGSFPDDRVLALVSKFPDLDVSFILTGSTGGREQRAELEAAWRKGGLEALLDRLQSETHIRKSRLHREHQLRELAASCSDQDLELLLRLAARLHGAGSGTD